MTLCLHPERAITLLFCFVLFWAKEEKPILVRFQAALCNRAFWFFDFSKSPSRDSRSYVYGHSLFWLCMDWILGSRWPDRASCLRRVWNAYWKSWREEYSTWESHSALSACWRQPLTQAGGTCQHGLPCNTGVPWGSLPCGSSLAAEVSQPFGLRPGSRHPHTVSGLVPGRTFLLQFAFSRVCGQEGIWECRCVLSGISAVEPMG